MYSRHQLELCLGWSYEVTAADTGTRKSQTLDVAKKNEVACRFAGDIFGSMAVSLKNGVESLNRTLQDLLGSQNNY